jgi:hypothetical protein
VEELQNTYEKIKISAFTFYTKDAADKLCYFDKRHMPISRGKKVTTNPLTIDICQGYMLCGTIGLKGDLRYRHHFDPKFSEACSFKQQQALKKKAKKGC